LKGKKLKKKKAKAEEAAKRKGEDEEAKKKVDTLLKEKVIKQNVGVNAILGVRYEMAFHVIGITLTGYGTASKIVHF